jgi:alanine-synthesizing transaminase
MATCSIIPLPDQKLREARVLLADMERARKSGHLIDLATLDPARCGLVGDGPSAAPVTGELDRGADFAEARAAVAGYLAEKGASVRADQVILLGSLGEAYARLLDLMCLPGEEVLVPHPGEQDLALAAEKAGVRLVHYPLRYDGAWHIDVRALSGAVTPRTRAILVGNPARPTGAFLDRAALLKLEAVAAPRGLALLGDERWLDTAGPGSVSVASATRCLALHVSEVDEVCGPPGRGLAWIVAGGQRELMEPALAGLEPSGDASTLDGRALTGRLARRGLFLGPLRERLTANRAQLAMASVREAPWSLLGGSGWMAALQIGLVHDEVALCRGLLEAGVAVLPGALFGFPPNGTLVVSLLPPVNDFIRGIDRLEHVLRAPLPD